jgi:hypothetical protein
MRRNIKPIAPSLHELNSYLAEGTFPVTLHKSSLFLQFTSVSASFDQILNQKLDVEERLIIQHLIESMKFLATKILQKYCPATSIAIKQLSPFVKYELKFL